MDFERLELHAFRLYRRQEVEFASGVNVLSGPNATGKTTVLEALSVLAVGRSFRGATDPDMVGDGQLSYRLAARYRGRLGSHSIEIAFTRGGGEQTVGHKVGSLDGHRLPRAGELLGRIPSLSFSPDDLALVKGGPADRRRFLDLLLVQTTPAYRDHLSRYHRSLVQRNALLTDLAVRRVDAASAARVLEPWDESLAAEAEAIQTHRAEVVLKLTPLAGAAFAGIDGRELALHYQPDIFDPHRSNEELRRRLTLSGAHRDELLLTVARQDARRFSSQGQQRSIVLALKLAALDILERSVGEKPVLLLDDVLSELDPDRAAALLPLLLRGQSVVTTTDPGALERALTSRGLSGLVDRWFTVGGGEVVAWPRT